VVCGVSVPTYKNRFGLRRKYCKCFINVFALGNPSPAFGEHHNIGDSVRVRCDDGGKRRGVLNLELMPCHKQRKAVRSYCFRKVSSVGARAISTDTTITTTRFDCWFGFVEVPTAIVESLLPLPRVVPVRCVVGKFVPRPVEEAETRPDVLASTWSLNVRLLIAPPSTKIEVGSVQPKLRALFSDPL
jgi:hypothetical protein